MFKFNRLVCALAVCTCVTVALGAAVKIRSFDIITGEGADADGMAILNYASGQDETVVQIILSDFQPESNYLYTLVSLSHCLTPGGGVITDQHGHATIHDKIGAPIPWGNCTDPEDGDWSDANIELTLDGVVHAIGINPGS